MKTTFSVLLAAALPVAAAAQGPPGACTHRGTAAELARRASPLDSVALTVDGAVVKVCYSRPSARGRAVMDSLVPFGQPWRLGANEPTRLTLPFAAEVAGVRVAPGTYSLYVVPSKTSWEVHVNRAVDQLTLRLVAGSPAELVVEWEKTRVRIPIRKAG
jgi:hypothetical protein